MELGRDAILVRNRHVVSTELPDGEAALLDVQSGSYFHLNSVASRLWQLIAEPVSLEQVLTALQGEFEVEADRCHDEVVSLVSQWLERGLSQVVT
ncbi:MAG: PqqD family protein [Candidatus Eremiobacteraeota bacterium]|nr:PqqD family protein [Candidatus Eremiobacteraeota bacterium]